MYVFLGFVSLPVRDMRPFLHQSGDDSAQRQERLVNVSRLASSLVHRTWTPDVLTASKIHLEEGRLHRFTAVKRGGETIFFLYL